MKGFLIRIFGVAVPLCVLVGGAALTPEQASSNTPLANKVLSNALEVSLAGEPGVDDSGLAGRGHVESGFAPLDINHPDFERPRRPALSRDEYPGEADQQGYRDASHTNLQSFRPAHHYYWRRRCLVYFLS